MRPWVLDVAEPLLLVMAGLVLSGLVSGIILLILGLVQRRRGLWVGGLVTAAVSFCLMGTFAIMALVVHLGSPPVLVVARRRTPATTFAVLTSLPSVDPLGLAAVMDDPSAVRIVTWDGDGAEQFVTLATPEGFGDVLDEHFRETTWERIRGRMGQMEQADGPSLSELPCYERSFTDEDGSRVVVWLCYDPAEQRAYCCRAQAP